MNILIRYATLGAFVVVSSACSGQPGIGGHAGGATAATATANAQFGQRLDVHATQDFEDARRGFLARPAGKITGSDGAVLIDFDAYRFVKGEAPVTVNPSLWRHAELDAQIGLFKVTDGVYQVRGFDIANMTLVEGRTGWIVVDTLTCRESSAAAMAFVSKHLGSRLVSAIVFTHSHVDHFGGALGVISPKEAADRKVPVIAPEGFITEATSENVMVGTAMGRRSDYQFGRALEHSATGNVDTGLGKGVAVGHFGILQPTETISQPTQELTLDGVRFVFHNVPGAEAPAELTFSIPDKRIYCGAEILAQTMHNLLPLRGAKVRDALRWADYLQQALNQLGDAEIYVGQHNWPIWGHARIVEFVSKQRDVYKYTHDQTVRLINAGYTPAEIAEKVKLPGSLASYFGTRGYYGDLRHNVKAVYLFYLGAYDGNPANLDPLPPQDSARRYVALMGGADKVVSAAQAAFDRSDFRWAVELLNHVVLGQPDHVGARQLLARTYEQMGYLSESAPWRNSYLTAAAELRNGPPKKGVDRKFLVDLLLQTPVERFLEALAAGVDGASAEGRTLKINLVIADTHESFVLWMENAVLHHQKAPRAADASATLTVTKELFIKMMVGTAGLRDVLFSDQLKVDGSRLDLVRFFMLIEKASGTFPIVTR